MPKDLRAILYKARQMDLEMPVIASSLPSNRQQIDVAFTLIRKTGKTRVGVLGLSFKAGTDDLRESPIVTLVERLIGISRRGDGAQVDARRRARRPCGAAA